MRKRIRWIVLLALAVIAGVLGWKYVPWKSLSAKYSEFSIADLSPVWYYTAVILFAVVVMALLWWALQVIPRRQAEAVKKARTLIKPAELFSIENEARKTLSQTIGGFIVIVSLVLTGANLAITSRLTEEGQITDRFTKAISQLGDKDKLEVRLGGIYALERIAKDSPKDHWTIMEVLTAYVRENAPRKEPPPAQRISSKEAKPENETQEVKPKPDIQAILTVIGRRKVNGEKNQIDLNEAELSGANLSGANLIQANLSRANLGGANLIQANLSRANLFRAHLNGADLIWANLNDANLRLADLRGAQLIAAQLIAANLSGADLRLADLSGADLSGANLSEAQLSGAQLSDANLSGADLSGAQLNDAQLIAANLRGAQLNAAQLIAANLSGADLRLADLRLADLSGADLREARNLTWEQISEARIDDNTTLPPEIENGHKDELKAMREKTKKRE